MKLREDERDFYYDDQDENIQQVDESEKPNTGRQEFLKGTRTNLMLRAGLRCSNPDCRRTTTAFSKEAGKLFSLGEAAHIVAAKEGGPRFDASYSPEMLRSIDNGIWLCSSCHTLIDKSGNERVFTVERLKEWKSDAENKYIDYLAKPRLDYINQLVGASTEVHFSFEKVSTFQLSILIYCIVTGNKFGFGVKTPTVDEDVDDDGFSYAYSELERWYATDEAKAIKNGLGISFRPTETIRTSQQYIALKSTFVSEMREGGINFFVKNDGGCISINGEDVVEYFFGKDYAKYEAFCNSILLKQ